VKAGTFQRIRAGSAPRFLGQSLHPDSQATPRGGFEPPGLYAQRGPVSTLAELHRTHPWWWAYCSNPHASAARRSPSFRS